MKKIVVLLFLLVSMINEAYLCSAFVLKNENKTLLGKNFDWTTDQGMVVKNIRNTKKYAYYTHNGQVAHGLVSMVASLSIRMVRTCLMAG
jgi:uncharacterized protein with ParB-like and HNH nuclease domain